MPVAEQICTLLSADLWDNLSPQASSMDVHNPHEACGYSYNGWTDARQPAYECPFFVHSETLNFELMWRRQLKKNPDSMGFVWGRVGLALMRCMELLVIFVVLATIVTVWYLL